MEKIAMRLCCVMAAVMFVMSPSMAETFNPDFKKGDRCTYKNTTTQVFEMIPGSKTNSSQISLITAAVEDINNVGPVVSLTTDDFYYDVTGYMAESIKNMLPTAMVDYMKGNVVMLQYDKHGKAVDVLNMDTIVSRAKNIVENCSPMIRPAVEASLNTFMQKDNIIKMQNTIGSVFGLGGIDLKENEVVSTNVPGMGNIPITCTKIDKSKDEYEVDFQSGTITDFPELFETTKKIALQQTGFTTITPQMEAQIDNQIKQILGNLKMTTSASYELFHNRWPEKVTSNAVVEGSPAKLVGINVEILCTSHDFH